MSHRQPMLFEPLVVAASVSLCDFGPDGWSVHIAARREGETWNDGLVDGYGDLTCEEAYDVICAALAVSLGLVPG